VCVILNLQIERTVTITLIPQSSSAQGWPIIDCILILFAEYLVLQILPLLISMVESDLPYDLLIFIILFLYPQLTVTLFRLLVEVVFDPTTTQGRECGTISILDDVVLEASEIFEILLNTINPDVIINSTANTSVIVITDDDSKHSKPLHSDCMH